MNLPELFLISLGLSMDCFAVSLTFGTSRKLVWRDVLRMALFFGLFQGMMPLIGWMVGHSMQSLIEPVDHWIAFAILASIGIKMVWQSFSGGSGQRSVDIRKITVLLTLSIATSIDALITGVGFGFIRANILEAVVIISIITFIVSVAGAKLGEHTTFIPARWAEFAGGLVLIAIGINVVLEHLGVI
ncbi:MAG: manganese efflux pump MntP family protein [Bacteroidetes bacterium]|nr:manganese efflux pump MntP family protein [Bacteroidota bacterium]